MRERRKSLATRRQPVVDKSVYSSVVLVGHEMSYGTTRISAVAHGILRQLSQAEGKPMAALLDEAVEALRRQRFLEGVNAAYASLRADPRAWQAIEEERRAWDATLPDGLAVAEGRAAFGPRTHSKRSRKRR